MFTVVESSKTNLAFDLAVTTVSFISIVELTLLSIDFLFRTISVGPVCSKILPTAAKLI
jgi:hypothetical protein